MVFVEFILLYMKLQRLSYIFGSGLAVEFWRFITMGFMALNHGHEGCWKNEFLA